MPSANAAELTVVAPSLRSGTAAEALKHLFDRASRGPVAPDRLRLLFVLFGCDARAGEEVPAGAVSCLGDTGTHPEGYWLRADPVHLRATLRDLFLEPPRSLGMTMDEAERLAQDIGRHFADRGWRLVIATPERWYLQAPAARLRTHSTFDAAGRNVNEFLPSGDDARSWRAILNELQMLLHEHPVNRQRESEGRPEINSLWFWGGGTLPECAGSQWHRVWSDDPLVKGLAALSQTPVSPLPAEPARLGPEMPRGGACLVVLNHDETSDSPHPLIPWLPFLRSDMSAQVTLLAPGEPALSLSVPVAGGYWRKLVARLQDTVRL